uniref:Protein transport protein sec16 n=1 Tax=Zea mays TaxID=4577 RepID=A0A804PSP2_MAIZE
MASDFDETDEAFFDKLVNSDDDDDPPAAAAVGGLAALSLTDQPDAPPPRESEPRDQPAAAAAAAAAPTEDAEREPSPEVYPAAVLLHPPPDLAATVGADPAGDLLPEDGEPFSGAAAVPEDHQGLEPSLSSSLSAGTGDGSAPDRTVSGHTESNASSQLDSSTAAEGSGHQSAKSQLEYTDPRYLESLYPGWKYDEATHQWYQVDTLNTQTYAARDTGGAVADLASGGSVQQHQQFSGSYIQNTSHPEPALELTEPTSESKPQLEPAAAPPQTDAYPAVASHKEEQKEHGSVPVHTKPEAQEIPANAGDTATVTEGGSPGSEKGIHTAVKQVQWNDFGASTGGADLFGDLLPDGAEDDFFEGTVPVSQDVSSLVGATNVSAPDHSFSAGVYNTAMISAGHSFSDGVDKNANSHFGPSGSSAGYGDQSTNAQLGSTDPKYLESLYPGWKYDEATQQWYQVDTHSAQSYVADNTGAVVAVGSDNTQQHQQQFSASYLQNNLHAALETIAEESSTNAMSWVQGGTNTGPPEYPPNMLFYAEYPGWYFDTNTQQWQTLESYQQSVAHVATTAAASDGFAGTCHNVAHYTEDSYASSYNQQSQWQPDSFGNTMQADVLGGKSLLGSSYGSNQQAGNQIGQQANVDSLNHEPHVNTFMPSTGQSTGSEGNQASYKSFGSFTGNQSWYSGLEHSTSKELRYKGFEPSTGFQTSRKEFQPPKDHQAGHMADEPLTRYGYGSSNGVVNTQNFVPKEGMHKTQMHDDSTAHTYAASNYWGTQTSMGSAQQQLTGTNGPSQQFGFSPHEQRSSAGRPPHTVVSFGFGGKLVVLKETSSMAANFDSGNQGNSGRTVSVLNIPEIVADKIDHSSIANGGAFSYFHALCRHPIPGPLVGGSAASKDLNKWLDDMSGVYESSQTEFQGGDVQKVLISLLKILCQHYGKLRSSFGSDPSQEGIDGPEMAVTKLFSSCKSSANMKGYGAVVHCMRNLPSESQIQTTAQEVQSLLVSGRRKEALHQAQEGHLWGPALILALQLGDKFYADTVKKMAHCHFVSGSPLRTLCLLIAGQPADVFSFENPVNSGLSSPQQPVEAAPKGMLDDWQENLAIITANRTKGDDLVITRLGDCLWEEKNEVASAHSCYLVAELNIDSYSGSARMCLIGADHLRCPRTFTSPEAIQRTEVYEYAKVLGNSQYILLPFQPYKLIYAYMLAEVGKISDSLKYCQASLKVLKSSGRAPELEAWKQLFITLEDRIRTHQQGGYATNLAPGKIVGKLFTSLDKSLSRMMGTQSAPLPQLPQGAANERGVYSSPDTKVVNSQSVMSMAPLVSSASEQSMSEIGGNSVYGREVAHNRSISEPDFGKTPQQQGAAVSSKAQSTSGSGSSRFGWLVQKTIGLVSKSHRQAKLGEQNKFYYDEKLKRWVEEGAEIPAEEPPLPPPPTKVPFQNSVPDPNSNAPPTGGGYSSNPPEPSSGMPPMPPTQNQFSARGRMGVRSRYVDTFNKGGGGGGANAFGVATSYSKPAAPSMSGAKFLVPTPVNVASEQMAELGAHSETARQDESSSSPAMETSFSSPPSLIQMQSSIPRYPSGDNIPRYPSGDNIPRYPSGDNIPRYPSMDNVSSPTGSINSSMSRSRASSWSGTYPEQLSSTAASRSPDGQMTQSPSMPGRRPPHSRSNSASSSAQLNGLGEDLHEVEL